MGVIMGKIIMRDTENQTQLILQAGDEKSLKKQVDGIDMLERKAKAFDEVIEKVKTEFVSEDLADSIRILVNDYEYDMEDK